MKVFSVSKIVQTPVKSVMNVIKAADLNTMRTYENALVWNSVRVCKFAKIKKVSHS